MTRVKVHYDGWIALPASVRRRFHLTTGDELELVPTSDGIMLRAKKPVQAGAASKPEVDEEKAVQPAPTASAPAVELTAAQETPAEEPAVEKQAAAAKRDKRTASTRASLSVQVQARGRRGTRKANAG